MPYGILFNRHDCMSYVCGDVMFESFDNIDDLMAAIKADEYRAALDHNHEFNIPDRTKETIDNYVHKGYKPGGFVMAMLANDLKSACGAADSINRRYIWDICSYIYNYIPHTSQGSYEAVYAWLENNKWRSK